MKTTIVDGTTCVLSKANVVVEGHLYTHLEKAAVAIGASYALPMAKAGVKGYLQPLPEKTVVGEDDMRVLPEVNSLSKLICTFFKRRLPLPIECCALSRG